MTKVTDYDIVCAIKALGGRATCSEIYARITELKSYVSAQEVENLLAAGTVNNRNRLLHYKNSHPRRCVQERGDLYYMNGREWIELYSPPKHGEWEIYWNGDRLDVRQLPQESVPGRSEEQPRSAARIVDEFELRDHLAANMSQIEPGMRLYVDENGVRGVEYTTPVGRIDLLALDKQGMMTVIELKVSKGPDSVAGQVLRYKNWVKKHLAGGGRVRGIINAHEISEQVLFAIADDPEISAMEYEISLRMWSVLKP